MYSTCLFCNADLGANEVIESFPVGRRLAFDSAKGRLWVVCRRCERWNLTPLEERLEAIEACERLFSSTRMRASTDNVGLARLRDGLELVRIGNPMRPEMAAWRYGDQFGRRRRRYLLTTGAGVVAVGGLMTVGVMTGAVAGGGWGLFQLARGIVRAVDRRRVRTHLRVAGSDSLIKIRARQLESVRVAREPGGWSLLIDAPSDVRRTMQELRARRARGRTGEEVADDVLGVLGLADGAEPGIIYRDRDALLAAGKLLPLINASGARVAEVQDAVSIVGEATSSDQLFLRYAGGSAQAGRWRRRSRGRPDALVHLPRPIRLALEMAAHEEQERRALEGELALLEAAWRDAEEIARIADDLFLPEDVSGRLERIRSGG